MPELRLPPGGPQTRSAARAFWTPQVPFRSTSTDRLKGRFSSLLTLARKPKHRGAWLAAAALLGWAGGEVQDGRVGCPVLVDPADLDGIAGVLGHDEGHQPCDGVHRFPVEAGEDIAWDDSDAVDRGAGNDGVDGKAVDRRDRVVGALARGEAEEARLSDVDRGRAVPGDDLGRPPRAPCRSGSRSRG